MLLDLKLQGCQIDLIVGEAFKWKSSFVTWFFDCSSFFKFWLGLLQTRRAEDQARQSQRTSPIKKLQF